MEDMEGDMNTMLSTGRNRATSAARRRVEGPILLAHDALREAELLLSRTEPQSLYSRHGRLDVTDLGSGWRVASEPREALAEALTVFVWGR